MVRKTIIFILLCVSISFSAMQDHTAFYGLNAQEKSKLDPMLMKLIADYHDVGTSVIQSQTGSAGNALLHRALVYTENPGELAVHGVRVNSVLPEFVTVTVTREQILEMTKINSVSYIKADDLSYPTNNSARGEIGADALHHKFLNNTPYTGKDVLVCIIDTGIDFEHYDFRDPDDPTQSRILAIWDQTLSATGGESEPGYTGLDYGVEYSQSQIEDEMNGVTSGFVRERDINGHGTHVAGTAAGNGASLSTVNYAGMAPEADILVVRAGDGSFPTTNIIDALTWAQHKFTDLGKPVVVNMSLGSQSTPHDGTDAKSQAIDNFSGPGRIAVVAAGNEGNDNLHFSGTVNASSTKNVSFNVPAYTSQSGTDNDDFWFDVWFDADADINVRMTGPGGQYVACSADASEDFNTTDGGIYIYNYADGVNGDRMMRCIVYDKTLANAPRNGTWTFRIANNEATSQNFHLWMHDGEIGAEPAYVQLGDSDNEYTLGNSADKAITVGSYTHRWFWKDFEGGKWWGGTPHLQGELSLFTSRGPTRDLREKPDITAPGDKMVSAMSQWTSPGNSNIMEGSKHVKMQGTSMASPVVAGAIALLLQQNNNLTFSQVQQLLKNNAVLDTYTGPSVWDAGWGFGKLNVFQAMGDLLSAAPQPELEVLAYDQYTGGGDYSLVTLGEGSNRYAAASVKFTPGISGQVAGCFLQTYSLDDFSLTGPVNVEIWTDVAGSPGSKLTSTNTVAIPQAQIQEFTMLYFNLVNARAMVQSGQDYHIVVSLANSSDALAIWAEYNYSIDSRSQVNNGSAWSGPISTHDFVIRPVIANGAGGIVPVTMAGMSARYEPGTGALLKWTTESEIRNLGFNILRSTSQNGPWQRINTSTIVGSGTSNEHKSYTFTDKTVVASGTVYYLIEQVDTDGLTTRFGPIRVDVESVIPDEYALAQNYPNPFNANTTLQYSLPQAGQVDIVIYNVRGEKVKTLYNGQKTACNHRLVWDGTADSGQLTASGIYWVRMQSGDYEKTVKMLFAK